MYWSHFGLSRQPFRAAVDPEAYFPSPSHEDALATLAAAYSRRDAIVLVDGLVGVGKSLLARRWLDQLPADLPKIYVPSAHAERPAGLLQALLFDLAKPYQGLTEPELRLAVTAALMEMSADREGPTVLVLDEAQHLSHAALEELRLLSNLPMRTGGALFSVLLAQPSLREALKRPAYELLAQRVGAQAVISPLVTGESADYLQHQLRAAGGEPDQLIDGAALAMIAAACDGNPRLLNRAATLAFDLSAGAQAKFVDVEAAMEALDRMGLTPAEAVAPDAVLLPHPARAEGPETPVRGKTTDRAEGNEDSNGRGPKDRASRKRTI